MYTHIVDKVFLFNIPRGLDLVDYINDFAEKNKVYTAYVQVIGYLENPIIAYYDITIDKYLENKLNGFYELVSGTGNISLKHNKPFLHIHVSISNREGIVYGGHLVSAKVVVAETLIVSLKGPLIVREKATNTLWLWRVFTNTIESGNNNI